MSVEEHVVVYFVLTSTRVKLLGKQRSLKWFKAKVVEEYNINNGPDFAHLDIRIRTAFVILYATTAVRSCIRIASPTVAGARRMRH